MRYYFAFLGSLLFATLLTASLRADDAAVARKAIEANYAKIDAATLKNDPLTTFSFMVPGGEHIHETGKVTKFPSEADRRDMVRMHISPQHPAPKVYKTVIQTFSLKGNEAMVTIIRHAEEVITTHDHKTHNMSLDGKVEDVWTKKGSRWLLKRRKEFLPAGAVDGKPVKLHS